VFGVSAAAGVCAAEACVVGREELPGGGDVEEGLEEVWELAVGSKGREGIAERLEITLELSTVLRIEGVEPAAAGEEPEARMAV
jgi:hypothetical protein